MNKYSVFSEYNEHALGPVSLLIQLSIPQIICSIKFYLLLKIPNYLFSKQFPDIFNSELTFFLLC